MYDKRYADHKNDDELPHAIQEYEEIIVSGIHWEK